MSAGLITKFSHKNSHLHHVKCKLHNRRLLASSTRVDDTNNNEGVEGTCPSAQPDPRTYLCERTLSPPSALLDTKNAHAQPFYIRGTLLILAHTQSHLLKTCTSLEIKANHIQKDSYARVHIISFPPRFTFFFYLSHSQRRGLPSYRTHTYIHTYIHTHLHIYISIYLYTTKVNTHEDLRWRTRPGYRRDTAKTVDQEHRELAVWFWNVRNRDRFFCCVGATMKRQISRVTNSSMTDRRIDSGLLGRRAIKNALSAVRGLYGRVRREVIRGNEQIGWQNCVNEIDLTAFRMRLVDEELRNLSNENLENELKELAMKMYNC